jgi:hypothetical protein
VCVRDKKRLWHVSKGTKQALVCFHYSLNRSFSLIIQMSEILPLFNIVFKKVNVVDVLSFPQSSVSKSGGYLRVLNLICYG